LGKKENEMKKQTKTERRESRKIKKRKHIRGKI
jgi:hypothetical protein